MVSSHICFSGTYSSSNVMLSRFNTFVRLLLVIFLVVPMYAEAQEVQVNEGFEDTTFESTYNHCYL